MSYQSYLCRVEFTDGTTRTYKPLRGSHYRTAEVHEGVLHLFYQNGDYASLEVTSLPLHNVREYKVERATT